MNLRALFVASLLTFSLPALSATEVIQLNNRSGDEMLPVVSDILGDEGRASVYGNQLIVNASPAKIGEIRILLQQLDTPPKRLLITLETDDGSTRSGYDANAQISAGNGHIQIGQGAQPGTNSARIISRNTSRQSASTQQVQATEGYPALIQVGQSVPLTTTSVGPYGYAQQQTQYRDVNRGFYVTATVHGDNVQLTISSQNDQLNRYQPGVINTQSTDTRVSGRLDQWISLGGNAQTLRREENGVLHRSTGSGQEDLSLRVKVQVLN